MECSAQEAAISDILPLRDLYRQEMNCQIVHDSFHYRENWTRPFLLHAGGSPAGYGSLVVAGPWKGKRTVFEFYVLPAHRTCAFDLFSTLLTASGADGIETQSNDSLLTVMLHTFAHAVTPESILFHDHQTTAHLPEGARFKRATSMDDTQPPPRREPSGEWVVEVDGVEAARGGVLYHYNRPYGDIYMNVAEPFRRLGYGSYLVQELKRLCYEHGNIPSARCNPNNLASRNTLQKAGFVPCGYILSGSLAL